METTAHKPTHIIIPVADLEAVIEKLNKSIDNLNRFSDFDPGAAKGIEDINKEIAAYEKILTHYKKVDLSEAFISDKTSKLTAEMDCMRSINLYEQGYEQACKDLTS